MFSGQGAVNSSRNGGFREASDRARMTEMALSGHRRDESSTSGFHPMKILVIDAAASATTSMNPTVLPGPLRPVRGKKGA